MKCSDIKADLSAFLDGELKEDRVLEVQNHVSECSSCREMMELLVATKTAFGALPAEEVSSGFSRKFHAATETSHTSSDLFRQRFLVPVALAASLVFILIWSQNGMRNGDSALYTSEITSQMLKMDFSPIPIQVDENFDLLPHGFIPGSDEYTPCLDPRETSGELGPGGVSSS